MTTYVAQGLTILLSVGAVLGLLWFGVCSVNYRYLYIDTTLAFLYLFVFHVDFSRQLIAFAGPLSQRSLLVNALYLPRARQTLVYKF